MTKKTQTKQTSESVSERNGIVDKPTPSEPSEAPVSPSPKLDDPVSQLKISLATLAKHVEAMGAVLGVPPRQNSPQLLAAKEALEQAQRAEAQKTENAHARPDMTQDEKKAQRAAKAAEKKARAEAAIAKKQAEANGEVQEPQLTASEFMKDMTPEEKKAQRAAKAAEKKARAEAAIAKKQASSTEQTPSTSTAKPLKESQQNGVSPSRDPEDDLPPLRPLPTGPPKKSALKPEGHNEHDDRKVKFGYNNDFSESSEDLFVYDNSNIPAPSKFNPDIHAAFQKLYTKCDQELIYEIDDLCTEFIHAFKEYYSDFLEKRATDLAEGVEKGTLGVDLKKAITNQISFLTENGRWPLPSALGNIVSQMKREINKMGKEDDSELLTDWIAAIEQEYFDKAYNSMATHFREKLKKSKHLLLYNCNRVMEKVLLLCKDQNITVCVVDDHSNGRGFAFAEKLAEAGFRTEYTTLQCVATVMQSASLTLIGCSSVLSNGNVAATKGSIQMCQMSQFFNLPTLFLVQSFKFVDKIHAISRMALLYREADEIVTSDLITALVTDIRILPPSSAPAVLKAKALDCLEA